MNDGELRVAIGSLRPPKLEAVREVMSQVAPLLGHRPGRINYIAREVESGVSEVPLSIHEIRRGARNRAEAVRKLVESEFGPVDFAIGLEGGLFILSTARIERVHLQSWAFAERGGLGHYGSSMSMPVPPAVTRAVIEKKEDLSAVIDRYAGRSGVRNQDGAFGVLSRGFLNRQQAFELALYAALAPFYNEKLYNLP